MHYHSIKMEEINRTIQELWVQTYQGSGAYHKIIKINIKY